MGAASRSTTFTLTDALAPSQVAVRTTMPGFRVITHPPAVTIATFTSLTLHDTVRPLTSPAQRSSGVAVSAKDSPARTDSGGGEICTAAIRGGRTVTPTLALASSSSAVIR